MSQMIIKEKCKGFKETQLKLIQYSASTFCTDYLDNFQDSFSSFLFMR